MGVSLAAARDGVEAIIGRGRSAPSGTSTPMTPRAKKVLGIGPPLATALGAGQVGPEHILLGLVHEGEGVGAEVLTRCGVDLADLERRLRGFLTP
jgi:ATP-dependent Clp protease ATP-binding subunit ClpC